MWWESEERREKAKVVVPHTLTVKRSLVLEEGMHEGCCHIPCFASWQEPVVIDRARKSPA